MIGQQIRWFENRVTHKNYSQRRVPDKQCWELENTLGKLCHGERFCQQRGGRWAQRSATGTLYNSMVKVHSNRVADLLRQNCQLKPISQLRFDYDTTMIRRWPRSNRLRWKWSKLRFAFDSTAIRLRHDFDEKLTFIFCLRRIASNGSRRARYVVVGVVS